MTPSWPHLASTLGRYSPTEESWDTTLTPSAVLVPLFEDAGVLSILMIERAASMGRHAGEIGFPGGVVEVGDEDLLATARREAREELALDVPPGGVLGRLDDRITGGHFVMRPFVARIESTSGLTPNPAEVAAIRTWPLAAFADRDACRVEIRMLRGTAREVPFFELPDVTVWGASASVILNLWDVIGSTG